MKMFNFLSSRRFISLIGIILVSCLIWYLGPLAPWHGKASLEPESNRLFLISLIAGIWLCLQLWTVWQDKRRNNAALAALGANAQARLSPDELASQDEIGTLQADMQDALAMLKKAQLGGRFGRQLLYQLPWYIIIGPPGSGKTTLLKTSDLKFPLANYGKDAIRGVGGTRHCDWWFTDEAVLLDTAGRYSTQDSHENVDKAAWSGFLDLLKKHRPRRPINGAIVAISIEDILNNNKTELASHAIKIRKRIQELHERFNIRFPVYLLFTKCDLISGFAEYFDELDRDKRGQVWGATFTLDETNQATPITGFKDEFNLLSQRLQSQVLDKLERERGNDRRNVIYTFPQQFNALGEPIQDFLNEIFQSTRYEHQAMVRGIYFTSATQAGSPIDRIMDTLAANFGLDRQYAAPAISQGKSYFINRLLGEVIFSEQGLAGTNLKFEKQRTWLQRGAFMATGALVVLMSLLWFTSYANNKTHIQRMAELADKLKSGVDGINPEHRDPLPLLGVLDEARNLPGGYAENQQSKAWLLAFGLSQGDKLGDAADECYRNLLKDAFLPRLLSRIEQQLRTANSAEYLYETLKVYLMFNDSEHYDPKAIRSWFNLDWKNNLELSVSNEQRQALAVHLNALLESQPQPLPRPLDADLIRQTRADLANTPIADRVYARLKLELDNAGMADFIASEKAGQDGPLVLVNKTGGLLNSDVPGLFTCVGYQDVFLKNKDRIVSQQASDNWVVGSEQRAALSENELKTLKDAVHRKYLEEYIRHWDGLMADIQIKPFSGKEQMVEVLNVVAGDNSPLKQLLSAIDKETAFACLDPKDKTLLDKAGTTLDTAQNALESIMHNAKAEAEPQPSGVSTELVSEHFKELHNLVFSKEGAPPPLDRPLSVLNELHIQLNALLHAGGDELVLEQRKQVMQVIDKVALEGKRNALPVLNKMLAAVAAGSNGIVSGGIRKHLDETWKTTVLPFCQKAIQGLYPITQSNREITFEDFAYFFGPNGLVDTFFTKYLAASVEKVDGTWRWNNRGEEGSGLSDAVLSQFQLADTIKNTFFRMGKPVPAVSFKLKPISMDPGIEQLVLDVDGQVLNYAHGPIRPVAMKWPGPNDSGQVSLQLLPPIEGNSGLSQSGQWALFRVFDQAQISKTADPTAFIISFNVHGREAKFELNANSAINPFQLSALQAFQCVPNL